MAAGLGHFHFPRLKPARSIRDGRSQLKRCLQPGRSPNGFPSLSPNGFGRVSVLLAPLASKRERAHSDTAGPCAGAVENGLHLSGPPEVPLEALEVAPEAVYEAGAQKRSSRAARGLDCPATAADGMERHCRAIGGAGEDGRATRSNGLTAGPVPALVEEAGHVPNTASRILLPAVLALRKGWRRLCSHAISSSPASPSSPLACGVPAPLAVFLQPVQSAPG
eukprot:scaffold25384_cov129-Isochrysis_galbana.AAC.1